MDERRAHQRFSCDLRARVVTRDGATVEGQAVDVSFAGICVLVDEPVEPSSRVRFHVWVAQPEGDSDELALDGKVVWSTPVEGRHQIGGTFDRDIDSYAWTRLDVLLQFLSGATERPERL